MVSMPNDQPFSPETGQNKQTFFEQHQPELIALFDVLEMPAMAGRSVDVAMNMTQPWVKGDHSRPMHQWDLRPDQKEALVPLFDKMGMVKERQLPIGHYDQIIVLGAIHQGNNRRSAYLKRMLDRGVSTDKIVLLGGQREIYEERERDDINTNIEQMATEGRVSPWVKNVIAGTTELKWETDLIRLAANAQMGELALKRLHLRMGNPHPGSEPDPIKKYDFDWEGTPVSLLHSLAVPRNGEPRHNTESCVEDWVKEFQPKLGDRVAFIAANPHLERMVRAAEVVLHKLGRDDVLFVPGGPASPDKIRESIYLGEVARSLYEDTRS